MFSQNVSDAQKQFQNTQKATKFFQTANRFGQQETTMVIGRQVVPVVSKMKKVNLLNPSGGQQSQLKQNATLNNFHAASQNSYRASQPYP